MQQRNNLSLGQAMLAAKAPASARMPQFIQNEIRNLRRRLWRRAARVRLQLARNLDGDTRAAFGAAGVNHTTASDGFHANPKAVCFLAACDGRLVGAFHGYSLLIDASG